MGFVAVSLCGLLAIGQAAPAPSVEAVPAWSQAGLAGLEQMEDDLVALVNAERAKAGVPALRPVAALRQAARQHSLEMLDEDYFSHESPHAEWKTPSDRAYRAGYWDDAAGENIITFSTTGTLDLEALPRTLMYGDRNNRDHGWMNSPGHKRNLLSTEYSETGLGVAVRGGKLYATQLFGNRWWDIGRVVLTDLGDSWRVSFDATLLRPAEGVYAALDEDVQGPVAIPLGQPLRLWLEVPNDGRRHRLGLHPGKGPGSFWIKYLFFVDTSRPLGQGLAMPFDSPGQPAIPLSSAP